MTDPQNRKSHDTISAAERLRRESAVNFACASVGLDGFNPSKEIEAQARKFINGEIQLAEFIQVTAETNVEPCHR